VEVKAAEVAPPKSPRDNQTPVRSGGFPSWLVPALFGVGCLYPFIGEKLVSSCNELIYPAPHGKMFPPPEYLEAVVQAMSVNTAIGFGASGALLVLVLGALIGATRGVGQALRGGVIGAGLGFLLIGAAAWLGFKIENYLLQEDMDSMLRTAMVLAAEFIAFALSAGLVMKLAGKPVSLGRTIGLSLTVGLAGLLAYILIAAIAIPTGWIEGMHPNQMSVRYLFFFCLSLSAVCTACLLLREPRTPRTASAA
jgi:hypothetical protein